jgi:hypothetical protein
MRRRSSIEEAAREVGAGVFRSSHSEVFLWCEARVCCVLFCVLQQCHPNGDDIQTNQCGSVRVSED